MGATITRARGRAMAYLGHDLRLRVLSAGEILWSIALGVIVVRGISTPSLLLVCGGGGLLSACRTLAALALGEPVVPLLAWRVPHADSATEARALTNIALFSAATGVVFLAGGVIAVMVNFR